MPRALLIVDHGSTHSAANDMLEGVAEIVRRQQPDLIVKTAHMELSDPSIPDGIDACVREGADEIVVHPYMLSPGRHATKDIPRMAKEAAGKHPGLTLHVTGPLGLHDKIGEVILERAGITAAPEPQSAD